MLGAARDDRGAWGAVGGQGGQGCQARQGCWEAWGGRGAWDARGARGARGALDAIHYFLFFFDIINIKTNNIFFLKMKKSNLKTKVFKAKMKKWKCRPGESRTKV